MKFTKILKEQLEKAWALAGSGYLERVELSKRVQVTLSQVRTFGATSKTQIKVYHNIETLKSVESVHSLDNLYYLLSCLDLRNGQFKDVDWNRVI